MSSPQQQADRTQQLYAQAATDARISRAAISTFNPRQPAAAGSLRTGYHHRPAARGGVSLFDLIPTGSGTLRVLLADAGGLGAAGGAVVGAMGRQLSRLRGPESPARVLGDTNQRLLELALPDGVVLSAALAMIDGPTGHVVMGCAGLPAPLLVSRTGETTVWHGSGGFLGVADAKYFDIAGELPVGAKLVFLAGGAGADRRPDVRASSERHYHLPAQPFADAVADDLLADADPDDGFTLVVVERTAELSGTMAQIYEE